MKIVDDGCVWGNYSLDHSWIPYSSSKSHNNNFAGLSELECMQSSILNVMVQFSVFEIFFTAGLLFTSTVLLLLRGWWSTVDSGSASRDNGIDGGSIR